MALARAAERAQDDLGEYLADAKGEAADALMLRQAPKDVRRFVRRLRSALKAAVDITSTYSGAAGASLKAAAAARGRAAPALASKRRGFDTAVKMLVLFAVPELELFTRHILRWWLSTPGEIAHARTKWTKLAIKSGNPPHLDDDLIREVLKGMKPSAMRKVPWSVQLAALFRCRVPACASKSLASLIAWRNEFSHLGRPYYRLSVEDPDFSEVMISWIMGLFALSRVLGQAATKRRP